MNPFANNTARVRANLRESANNAKNTFVAARYQWVSGLAEQLIQAIDHIETLEAELRTKNDELHTLRFIGQTPEHLDAQPGALQIVPGPPTLIKRIKAAIAALKGK